MKTFCLSFFLLVFQYGHSGPRHVYLTWEKDTSTTITINTHHLTSAQIEIYYDTEPHDGKIEEYSAKISSTGYSFLKGAGKRFLFHTTLTSLLPDQIYYFVIQDADGEVSKEISFRTIPENAEHYRFISGGDWEVTDVAHEVAIQAAKQDPLAVFLGGDYPREVESLGDYIAWDEWLDMYTATMITPGGQLIPMVMAIGNNDVFGGFGQKPDKAPFYYHYFKQNAKNQSYFSKQFGQDLCLFVLDSGHTASYRGKQLHWLKKKFKKVSQSPIKLAIYHVPIYPSIRFKHPSLFYRLIAFILTLKGEGHISHKLLSEGSVRGERYWVPQFDKYRLTAAFEHHDQTLKRTKRMKGGKVDPTGTVYLGDGGWGPDKQFTPIQTILHSYFAKTIGHVPFFWLIDTYKDHIIYHAITSKGNVIDEYTQPLSSNE